MAAGEGVARYQLGAGVVAGLTALLAAVVILLMAPIWLGPGEPVGRSRYLEELELVLATLVIPTVFAMVIATVYWRADIPDEPAPRKGALGGVVTGIGSIIGFGLVFASIWGTWPIGPIVFVAVLLFIYVPLFGAIVCPLGAFGGWAYERLRSGPRGD